MATRKDIAQRAGVSISVVSRALNNSGYVDAGKKKKILQIAKELDYHPNPVAMSLMSQHTKQILFYCRELKNAFNIEMYEGMLEAAGERDYKVLIYGNLDFSNIRSIMVDGLVLPNESVAEMYLNDIGKNYHLPVVTASYGGSFSFSKSIPMIECDLWEGTRTALQYLWDRGHRKIAIITPYDDDSRDSRLLSWNEFMKYELGDRIGQYYFGINRRSLPNDDRLLAFPEERGPQSIYMLVSFFEKGLLAADIFHERSSDATAVLCFNDEVALGFYKGLKQLGYKVPKDVSLMGVDGVYSRRYADLALTSLSLNPKAQGQKCVENLLNIIDGKKPKYITQMPMRIMEGETVQDLRH
ncbi:LacI family transcriptional regulator [Parablautia intestinalis]|uniref:LacI family transcriptional regulator n=1 Tax=Parablautia intestinalis TaxID=2320100 RepID=A0A3A9B2S4_9FIRM|nr:LacI family DNA-binding transcriptional regulator [Parablautia intestinalis]RKI94053.1 LacI family transcriptional regulator [Parablautia intestinalis]